MGPPQNRARNPAREANKNSPHRWSAGGCRIADQGSLDGRKPYRFGPPFVAGESKGRKLASGRQCYGGEIRFGPKTDCSIVPTPAAFTVQGEQLLGLVHDGNLRRQPIKAAEF
jgi:hypothetical protein